MYNFIELRELIAIILKRWWLLALAALIGGALGYGISLRQIPIYQATTSLLVGRSIQTTDLERSDLQTSELLAITYANVVRRRPVLQGTIDTLQLNMSWQALRARVTVAPVDQTQLLEIKAEAESPELAEQIANEVANQLILISPSSAKSQSEQETHQFVQQRLKDLEQKINGSQQELQTLEAKLLSVAPATGEAKVIRDQIKELEDRLLSWDSVYSRLLDFTKTVQSTNQLAIVEAAQAGADPIRPRVELNIMVGIAVALCLVLALIFLLEYLDDTLKSVENVTRQLGLNALGAIGQIKGKNSPEKLISKQHVFSSTSEDYRLVRSKLQFLTTDLPQKIIMVTSPTQGEGKSLTIANLGIVMAEAGLKVAIVDANLRRPMQHEIFQLPNGEGLTELLYAPKLQLDNYLKVTQVMNLRILTAGSLPAYPSEMLGSLRMKQLLDVLAAQVDIVLCDSPEATGVADAAILAQQVTGALLVVQSGKTRRDLAQEALSNLRQAGARLFGVVLNQSQLTAPRSKLGKPAEIASLTYPVETIRPESLPG